MENNDEIKKQKEEEKLKIKNEIEENLKKQKEEAIKLIKPIFIKYNAINEKSAMMKEEILAEIENSEFEKDFKRLKSLGIIKKKSNKYFYDEKCEENNKQKSYKYVWISIIVAVICAIVVAAVIFKVQELGTNTITTNNIQFKVGKTWQAEETQNNEYYGWNFYKYINTTPNTNSNTTNASELSYNNYPASINVYTTKITEQDQIKDFETLKTALSEYINELGPDDKSSNEGETKNGYQMITYKLTFNQTDDVIGGVEYVLYALKGENILTITAVSYSQKDDLEMEKEIVRIANSFEWLN